MKVIFKHYTPIYICSVKLKILFIMETLAHSKLKAIAYSKTNSRIFNWPKFWQMMEFNRFGVISWTLLIVACFSGIVAGLFVDGTSLFQITLIAASTMFTLCMILAVAPIKIILTAGVLSVFINILLMVFS